MESRDRVCGLLQRAQCRSAADDPEGAAEGGPDLVDLGVGDGQVSPGGLVWSQGRSERLRPLQVAHRGPDRTLAADFQVARALVEIGGVAAEEGERVAARHHQPGQRPSHAFGPPQESGFHHRPPLPIPPPHAGGGKVRWRAR